MGLLSIKERLIDEEKREGRPDLSISKSVSHYEKRWPLPPKMEHIHKATLTTKPQVWNAKKNQSIKNLHL
jgi:hypothetical protein